MPEVFPIAITQIDWPTLLRFSKENFGREITRKLDEQHVEAGTPLSYLKVIAEFGHPDSQNQEDHLFFSFVVKFDPEFESFRLFENVFIVLGKSISIQIESNGGGAILSGTLTNWKETITRGAQTSVILQIRQITNQIFYFFEQAGLREVWKIWRKKSLGDGTWILELIK